MHVGCSTKASAVVPVPCGSGDGYHQKEQAFPWHSRGPCPECFHVNAAHSPGQPPAGAVAPGTAGRGLAEVGRVPRGRRWPWCPGGGTCVNGMSSAREEMSLCAVTLCSASCLCLWAEWALQAPQFHVVLSQKVKGWLKADKIHVFIHSWLFTHREAPPVQEGGKHWPVLCPIPIQGSQFAILSVHLWRLLKCEGKEWRFSKVLSG